MVVVVNFVCVVMLRVKLTYILCVVSKAVCKLAKIDAEATRLEIAIEKNAKMKIIIREREKESSVCSL